jgi:hypothetical protein
LLPYFLLYYKINQNLNNNNNNIEVEILSVNIHACIHI